MRLTALPLILLLAAAQTPALAQKENTKGFGFGIAIDTGTPFGGASASKKGSAGLDLRFGYRVGPGFVTLTLGIQGFSKATNSEGGIPNGYFGGASLPELKAGYKYFFVKHLFVMGELGVSHYRFDYENNDVASVDRGNCPTIAPAVGAQFGILDLSVRVQSYLAPKGTLNLFALRIGIDF